MAWGYDHWLLDRAGRHQWMRSVALLRLTEQILRTPASAIEALTCILDEVRGDANPALGPETRRNVAKDLREAGKWLRGALAAARTKKVSFQSLAFTLSEVHPYRLELEFVKGDIRVDAAWEDAVTWRSPSALATALLDTLIPTLGELPVHARRDADYIVPLSYSAFLIRDVFRSAGVAARCGANTVVVGYSDGDTVSIPMARPGEPGEYPVGRERPS